MAGDNIKYSVSVATGGAKKNVDDLIASIGNLYKAIDTIQKKGGKLLSIDADSSSIDTLTNKIAKMQEEINAVNGVFKETLAVKQELGKKLNGEFNKEIKELADDSTKAAKEIAKIKDEINKTQQDGVGSKNNGHLPRTKDSYEVLDRARRLGELRKAMEENYNENYGKNMDLYRSKAKAISSEFTKVKQEIREIESYTKEAFSWTKLWEETTKDISARLAWFTTRGIAWFGLSQITSAIGAVRDIEVGMASFSQVMAHGEQNVNLFKKALADITPEDLSKGLNTSVENGEHFVETLHKMQDALIDLSVKYGATSQEAIESATLWGRAYKDNETVLTLTQQATKLAIADNFSIVQSNKALESSIMQWGYHIQNAAQAQAVSNMMIDSWTALSHNYTVSANTLVEANRRMAQSAKEVGVSFHSAQALISVMARKTMAEGGEIGNALKSIFGSIHSDKAIGELERIGVQVYKIGESGKKEFRAVDDVLVDLMIHAQTTNENMEELLKGISGGKFQWNKAGAMLDLKEYLTALEISTSSRGFGEQQVAMQLDTIDKKLKSITAQLEKMTSGHHGMATIFKGALDIILWLLQTIDKIHPAVSLLILTLPVSGKMFTKLAVEGQAALTKLSSKFTELITKVRAFTLSMRGASNATSAMGATATTSVGAVGRAVSALEKAHWILAAIGVAYQLYQSYVGSANEKEAEHIDTLNKEIEVYDEQLRRMEESYPLIERMTNTYNSLSEKRKGYVEGSAEEIAITKEMDKARKILVNTVGEEEAAILTTGQATRDDIEKVQQKYRDKEDTIRKAEAQAKEHIDDAAAQIKKHTSDVIAWINNEETKWWDLIFAIMNYMTWAEAAMHISDNLQLSMAKSNLAKLESDKANYGAESDSLASDSLQSLGIAGTDIDTKISQEKATIAQLEEKVNSRMENLKSSAVAKEMEKINTMRGAISSSTPDSTRSEVPTGGDDGKHHGGGHHKEEDPEKKEAKALKERYEAYRKSLELTSKDTEQKYKRALDDVSDKEKLHGETVQSMTEKLEIHRKQYDSLKKSLNDYTYAYNTYLAGEFTDTDKQKIKDSLGVTLEEYSKLTPLMKQEKLLHLEKESNKVLYEKLDNINKISEEMDKLNDKIKRDTTELEVMKRKIEDTDYNKKKEINDTKKALSDEEMKYVYENSEDKHKREIQFLETEVQLERDKLELMKQRGSNSDELLKQELALKKVENAAKNYAKTLQKDVRQSARDVFKDIVMESKSIKDVWKKLWKGLADDALNALFRIGEGATSPLGKLLNLGGLFGGGGGSKYAMTTFRSGGAGWTKFLGHENGGIVDEDAIYRAGEHGKKEMVIPLDSNSPRSRMLLKQTASHLGVSADGRGVQPVFKNKDVASGKTASQISRQTKSMSKLESLTESMVNILTFMANNQQNASGGQATIMQPVITKQTMTDAEFARMYQKLGAQGKLNGRR
ncbi:phage tail tape measure protein [Veillonella sp. 3310]|uniref:phage tail tape measure protein n=1 Tax=Veillonella sp. 3310 TaxID=2490956 RepID=UPI000FD674EA|nr:phage tail tape measure protein [Veillonella sp. 3310]